MEMLSFYTLRMRWIHIDIRCIFDEKKLKFSEYYLVKIVGYLFTGSVLTQ